MPQSPDDFETLAAKITDGDLRTAARVISAIDNEEDGLDALLSRLYLDGGHAKVIGVTGPPGAGKSTLVDQLIAQYRAKGETVAVIAVDPSSPYTGGALLGDRIRMGRHSNDAGVFIRSLSSRGQLGGLSKATADTITVIDAMKWDRIIIETVGVGQNETDIVKHADTVVLLQTPESGDAVQAIKAGLLEIGDIFVINKADHPETDRMLRGLKDMIGFRPHADWTPPVLKVQASVNLGVTELVEAVADHHQSLGKHSDQTRDRQLTRARSRVRQICESTMLRKLLQLISNKDLEGRLEDIISRKTDPYSVAAEINERIAQRED